MASIHTYPDELPSIIDGILAENGTHNLFVVYSKMTEVEQRKIFQNMKSVFFSAKSVLEKNNNNIYLQKLISNFSKDPYYLLCLSIANFSLHKNLTGAETALQKSQRKAIRTNAKAKRTCKDKLLSVCLEIDSLKSKGTKWKDIIYWLKTGEHRKMFYVETLDVRNVRRIYAEWKEKRQ